MSNADKINRICDNFNITHIDFASIVGVSDKDILNIVNQASSPSKQLKVIIDLYYDNIILRDQLKIAQNKINDIVTHMGDTVDLCKELKTKLKLKPKFKEGDTISRYGATGVYTITHVMENKEIYLYREADRSYISFSDQDMYEIVK